METIITVLSTIGVGALSYAFAGVIRLSRRVNDLELVRMEMDDMENRCQRGIDSEIQERCEQHQDIHRRIDEYQVQVESSTDRRFDKVWDEVHKLDKTINPNMDKIKGLTK
mgnify:FL=1|tara:strand:- start:86 stop:418 length:333 start_codon:yes stop_codon:yes gene_type:complete